MHPGVHCMLAFSFVHSILAPHLELYLGCKDKFTTMTDCIFFESILFGKQVMIWIQSMECYFSLLSCDIAGATVRQGAIEVIEIMGFLVKILELKMSGEECQR